MVTAARVTIPVAVLAVAAVVFVLRPTASASPQPATVIPFTLPGVADASPGLAIANPPLPRPVVLNFFGSWCEPCRKELPLLQAVSQRAAGKVDVAGVDMRDGRTPALELLAQAGVTFPTGADPDLRVSSQYRVRGGPTTIFVARSGRVLGVQRGPLTQTDLDRWIGRLERSA
jgi:thiol-disulfide isomerase/thioredoxin